MIRILQPWFVNMGKRLVKRSKLYVRDSEPLPVEELPETV